MDFSTNFGNGAAGGFFNEENRIDSPSQNKDKGKTRRHQNITPILIVQLLNCEDDEFTLFGMPTQMLSAMAMLRSQDVQSTKATYIIEDHTGSIKAIRWLESESKLPKVKDGHYVRIFGAFRVYSDEKMLMIMSMTPVESLQEITTHRLEAISARLQAEAASKPKALGKISANNPAAALANSMSYISEDNNFAERGITKLQEKIYKYISADTSSAGLPLHELLKNFSDNEHGAVKTNLTFLIDEGHAYSTTDDLHYKVTSSM